ncbi:hypothetical protein [Gordonia sp. i37]|uniref:hypothetical protein n=1 Tax=Gordonia sp. i37 TaxID=1961707 RepID=UPI0009ABBBFD|nr:hypothetical protein [Gordonia sp. i37]OPX14380.1 hypothetical protein B1964_15480 [Gordonia sp. i37]
MNDQYNRLDAQADTGLGAEEFAGPARFTRPVERTSPIVDSTLHRCCGGVGRHTRDCDDILDPRVRLRMLDRAADLLADVLTEMPQQDPFRDRLRDLAFAVKDVCDDIAHENGPGSAATDSEANVSHPSHEKENR